MSEYYKVSGGVYNKEIVRRIYGRMIPTTYEGEKRVVERIEQRHGITIDTLSCDPWMFRSDSVKPYNP